MYTQIVLLDDRSGNYGSSRVSKFETELTIAALKNLSSCVNIFVCASLKHAAKKLNCSFVVHLLHAVNFSANVA